MAAFDEIGNLVKQMKEEARQAHLKIQYVQNVCFGDDNSREADEAVLHWKCRFGNICGHFFNLCECPCDDENYAKENLKRLLSEFAILCREIDLCKKELYNADDDNVER